MLNSTNVIFIIFIFTEVQPVRTIVTHIHRNGKAHRYRRKLADLPKIDGRGRAQAHLQTRPQTRLIRHACWRTRFCRRVCWRAEGAYTGSSAARRRTRGRFRGRIRGRVRPRTRLLARLRTCLRARLHARLWARLPRSDVNLTIV